MNKKKISIIFLCFFLLLCLNKDLHSYIYTEPAYLTPEGKFIFRTGYSEFNKKGLGSIFEIPFIVHLGLSTSLEWIVILPYLQQRRTDIREGGLDTFGDLLLFFKIQLTDFSFKYPLCDLKSYNTLTLVLGANGATGPSMNLQAGRDFWPFSLGTADFRWGLLFTQEFGNLSWSFDFIYTFAAQPDEQYLPFSGNFWGNNSYLFGLVNVLVKFLWPGRYPWADDSPLTPEYEKYPHIDDFFNWNIGFNYFLNPSWLIFSYDLFIEFNWLKSWSSLAVFPSYFIITPGIQIHLTETISITGGGSFLMNEQVYQYYPETTLKRPFHFDYLYFVGVRFFL